MLARCTDHARAFCRISIAELRRVAPPAFYVLMVISLLLADGLFPVFASKHRSQGSLYTSSNLARASSGVNNGDVVLYARSNNNNNNNNNNRYRTKVRVKSIVSKKGDSVMSGVAGENGNSDVGTESANSRLMRPRSHSQPHVRDVDASEGGSDRRRERERTDSRRINSGSSDNSGNDYEQLSLSLHLDERSASSSSQSLPSSLSSSPSSSSSLKPSPSLPSLPFSALSPSLASDSLSISNSSNSLEEGVRYPSGVTSSGAFPNDNDACQLISPIKQDACKTLVPNNQCLVLTAATAEMVCGKCQKEDRISFMRNARLRFCSSFPAALVSCASDTGAGGICPLIEQPSACLDYLKRIVASDDKAEEMYGGFKGLIGRYDCTSNYSVKWHCHHCKVGCSFSFSSRLIGRFIYFYMFLSVYFFIFLSSSPLSVRTIAKKLKCTKCHSECHSLLTNLLTIVL